MSVTPTWLAIKPGLYIFIFFFDGWNSKYYILKKPQNLNYTENLSSISVHFSLWNLFTFFFPFQEFALAWKQVSKQLLSILKEKWLGTPQCHCTWQVSGMYLPSFTELQTLGAQKVPQPNLFSSFILIWKRCICFCGLIEKICFCLLKWLSVLISEE